MKFTASLIFALLFPIAALAAGEDMQKATDAASSWLALVDTNAYSQSWDAASSLLKNRISEPQWETAGKHARDPFGTVVTRKVAGVSFADTLPGAPDGHYAVVRFNTQFTNKAAATETITMAMDNGDWKTAGYFVK